MIDRQKWLLIAVTILITVSAIPTTTAATASACDGNPEGLNLNGWTISDETSKRYTFNNYSIQENQETTLRTGNGTDNKTNLYWNYGSPVWNNGGDTIILRNGSIIDQESYDTGNQTFSNTDSLKQLEVTEIQADAPGTDSDNLNQEYVVLQNKNSETLNLSGWSISDDANKQYIFPDSQNSELAPNDNITIHTGNGTDNETDLYWGYGSPAWNNNGDTIYLRDGIIVDMESYSDSETVFEFGDTNKIIELKGVHADAEGSDYDNLNDEYINFTYPSANNTRVALENVTPTRPEAGDNVTVNATAEEAEKVCLEYTDNDTTRYTGMTDVGGGLYQADIPGQAPRDNVSYRVYAVGADGETDTTERRNFSVKPLDIKILSGDPIHTNNEFNFSVYGSVQSYRDNVNDISLSVNGTQREASFNVTDFGDIENVSSNKTLFINVTELSGNRSRVKVSVTNSSRDVNDTVVLDGDGLNESVEMNVTETDPTDRDSDSGVTSEDESGNGVPDGLEDYDDDGLSTSTETGRFGLDTSPFDADSDSDGLGDGFETRYGFDPVSNDTDGDGTVDSDWDPDLDGLDNLREQDVGTDPRGSDTDSDGLNDSEEVDVYNTEPFDEDTDNDSILDGNEIRLGTDPLSDDSDGDGTKDQNETYTSTKENERVNITVNITGEGYVAKNVSITPTSGPPYNTSITPNNSLTSQGINIESGDSFENATIEFEYNESHFMNESKITVARLNETSDEYEPVDTKIDEGTNIARANVSEFSQFTIIDILSLGSLIATGGGRTSGSVELSGVQLRDECCDKTESYKLSLDQFGSLRPGESVIVRTADIDGIPGAVWNNDKGDTIKLVNTNTGKTLDQESYDQANESEKFTDGSSGKFSSTEGQLNIVEAMPNGDGNDNMNKYEYVKIKYIPDYECNVAKKTRNADRLLGFPSLSVIERERNTVLSSECDTDMDGLDDSKELGLDNPIGSRVAPTGLASLVASDTPGVSEKEARNTEVGFETIADPTDKNTDNVGADDGKEYDVDTEPKYPESVSVSAQIPIKYAPEGEKIEVKKFRTGVEKARAVIPSNREDDGQKVIFDIRTNIILSVSNYISNHPSEYEDELPSKAELEFTGVLTSGDIDINGLSDEIELDKGINTRNFTAILTGNSMIATKPGILGKPQLEVTFGDSSLSDDSLVKYQSDKIYAARYNAKDKFTVEIKDGIKKAQKRKRVLDAITIVGAAATGGAGAPSLSKAVIPGTVTSTSETVKSASGVGFISIANRSINLVNADRFDQQHDETIPGSSGPEITRVR